MQVHVTVRGHEDPFVLHAPLKFDDDFLPREALQKRLGVDDALLLFVFVGLVVGGVRNGGGEGCRKSRSAEEEEVHGTRTDDISALKLETARPHNRRGEGWEVEVGSGWEAE